MEKDNKIDNKKMAMTPQGMKYLLIGMIVMICGGSKDPAVFNYAMFDFRRLVAAPIVILCGIIIEIISIMKVFKNKEEK